MGAMDIPLMKMEQLEKKYNIALFLEQNVDTKENKYYLVLSSGEKLYLGDAINKVERMLKDRYDNENI